MKILHALCNNIFKSKKWPSQWIESILIPSIPKKANSRKCSDFRTISLISHASKVLLKIIQRRIQPRIGEVLDESQAGFRRDRSTTEQITNITNIIEKIRDSRGYVFHNFIDFKKAFDRVWHKALWHTMKKFNIGKHLTELIKELYEKAITKVMTGNGQFSEWFKTSVGVRQGCILSPILFNVFLERIMLDTLEGFDGGIRCGGMKFLNLRFADDIDLLAEGEEELQEVTDRLNITSKKYPCMEINREKSKRRLSNIHGPLTRVLPLLQNKYGMEINREKSKVMVTGSCNGRKDININIDGKPVEQVTMFKYLGATITEDATSRKEIEIRICQATVVLARLSSIWKANTTSIDKKQKLLRAIVTSTLLYG